MNVVGVVGKESGSGWKGKWEWLERKVGVVGKESGSGWKGKWEWLERKVGVVGKESGSGWKGKWEWLERKVGVVGKESGYDDGEVWLHSRKAEKMYKCSGKKDLGQWKYLPFQAVSI